MSNKSLFLQALEQSPAFDADLTSLNEKLADISTLTQHEPMQDPLDNPDFGPARIPDVRNRGRNIGRLAGGLLGAGIGGYTGHIWGGLAGNAVQHPIDTVSDLSHGVMPDIHSGLGHAGSMVGGAHDALLGGLVGSSVGGDLGAGIGSMTKHLYSPERQAADKIRKMDPATAMAHIRMTEHLGKASPSVLQSMKDTFNARRQGLRDQIESGVPA
jgi:hypothetical protein